MVDFPDCVNQRTEPNCENSGKDDAEDHFLLGIRHGGGGDHTLLIFFFLVAGRFGGLIEQKTHSITGTKVYYRCGFFYIFFCRIITVEVGNGEGF
jgi:hypothetical protein